ncbi:hypothetical protein EVC08_039 [Rhizobium phage RHph_N65]|nr:hypothetical protein EVC08_039 [Rhizobium phage RHph_N65]
MSNELRERDEAEARAAPGLRWLLNQWLITFGDECDAGPPGHGWQSDELVDLIALTKGALRDIAGDGLAGFVVAEQFRGRIDG